MKLNIFILIGVCIPAIIASGCKEEKKAEISRTESPRSVVLEETETVGNLTSRNYSGVIEEGKSVSASFMTGGKLVSLRYAEGDRVRKGELLAVLDDVDYQIGVHQLEVQYEQMGAEKARMDEMFARHNVAPNDYEKLLAGYEQLGLQLEMAKNKLGYTKLYAPADGFISYKYKEPGELVDAGTPIYKITDDSSLNAVVDLPVSIYLNRKDISAVNGVAPGITGKIPLSIESFTPDADNNQLYHMRLNIPKSRVQELTTGMNISVEIAMKNSTAGKSYISSRSIFDVNDTTFVWVFNEADSTLSKKAVKVVGQAHSGKNMVEGLDGSERIVSAGIKHLNEGEKVVPYIKK